MKRATVKIGGVIQYGPIELPDAEMQVWIDNHKSSWGTDAYTRLVSPAQYGPSPVPGEPDVEISPAVYEQIPATYELILEDVTAEVLTREMAKAAKLLKKKEAKDYIQNLDTAKLTTVASVKNVMLKIIDLIMEE